MTKSKNNKHHKKTKKTSRARRLAEDPVDPGPPPDAMKPPGRLPLVDGADGLTKQRNLATAPKDTKAASGNVKTGSHPQMATVGFKAKSRGWSRLAVKSIGFAICLFGLGLRLFTSVPPHATHWATLDHAPTAIPSAAPQLVQEPAPFAFTIVSSGPLVYLPEISPQPLLRSARPAVFAPPARTTSELPASPAPSGINNRNGAFVKQPPLPFLEVKLTTMYRGPMDRLHWFRRPLRRLIGIVGCSDDADHPPVPDDWKLPSTEDRIQVLQRQLHDERLRCQAIEQKAKEDHRAAIIANHHARRVERQAAKARREEGVRIRANKEWRAYLSVPRRDTDLVVYRPPAFDLPWPKQHKSLLNSNLLVYVAMFFLIIEQLFTSQLAYTASAASVEKPCVASSDSDQGFPVQPVELSGKEVQQSADNSKIEVARPVELSGNNLERSHDDGKIQQTEVSTIPLRELAQTAPELDDIGAGDFSNGAVERSKPQMRISNEVFVKLPNGSPRFAPLENLETPQMLYIAGDKDSNDGQTQGPESPRQLAKEVLLNLPVKASLRPSPEPAQATQKLQDDIVDQNAEWTAAGPHRKSKVTHSSPATGKMSKEKAESKPAVSIANPRFPTSENDTKAREIGRIGKKGPLVSAKVMSPVSAKGQPPATMRRSLGNSSPAIPSGSTCRFPTLTQLPTRRTGQSVSAAWNLCPFQPPAMAPEDWPTLRESISTPRPATPAPFDESANPTSEIPSKLEEQEPIRIDDGGHEPKAFDQVGEPRGDALVADIRCEDLLEEQKPVEVGGCQPDALDAHIATFLDTNTAIDEVCPIPHVNGPPSAIDTSQTGSAGMVEESEGKLSVKPKAIACLDDISVSEAMEKVNLGLHQPVCPAGAPVDQLGEMWTPRRPFKGRKHKEAPLVQSSLSPGFTLATRSNGRICIRVAGVSIDEARALDGGEVANFKYVSFSELKAT